MSQQLLDLLRQHGEMSTTELAEVTGKSLAVINNSLCKAAAYGYVGKTSGYEIVPMRRKAPALNKWKLQERK